MRWDYLLGVYNHQVMFSPNKTDGQNSHPSEVSRLSEPLDPIVSEICTTVLVMSPPIL